MDKKSGPWGPLLVKMDNVQRRLAGWTGVGAGFDGLLDGRGHSLIAIE